MTLDGVFQRHPTKLHLNSDGLLIHEPPYIGKIKAFEFFDGFKKALKQTFEKSVSSYVENNEISTTDDFEDFA